jgi:hypothetical protein
MQKPGLMKITFDLTLEIDLMNPLDLCSGSLEGFPDLKDFGPFLS